MNLDWRRLKAVVLESDDWGLCAWSADEQAYRVLADTPAFRSLAGQRYGGSTLESAADVRVLAALLLDVRGGDGFPAVLQANTIVAAPDYARLVPPLFEVEDVPLVDMPDAASRWKRPGLREAVAEATSHGVWWAELHGLTHIPMATWLAALRRGTDDARRAHEQQSPICAAVEASGEFAPAEPLEDRRRDLRLATDKFTRWFGRAPASFCPPDYRWDERLDRDAEGLGLRVFQGVAEMAGARLPRVRRLLHRFRWPHFDGNRFAMPPRIAFEPVGPASAPDLGVERTVRAVRDAWNRGQPAVISSHRMNYVHLHPGWAEHGREALRELLRRLCADGAVFVVDLEVRALVEQGWSVRAVGPRGALLRYHGVPGEPVTFPVPEGTARVVITDGRSATAGEIALKGTSAEFRGNVGEYLLEWKRA